MFVDDQDYNITNQELNDFFGGPAFLAWARMGNLHAWVPYSVPYLNFFFQIRAFLATTNAGKLYIVTNIFCLRYILRQGHIICEVYVN